MIFDPILIGWIIWWVVAANAALLYVWLAIRMVTWQPLGRVLPAMTIAMTLLAVWFFVNAGWNKLHLAWLYPTTALAVSAGALVASVK